ncbi:MAG: radical SAM protein [Candidatus Woesearchaeota archaeon]
MVEIVDKLVFQDLEFFRKSDGLKVVFLKNFFFELTEQDLKPLGEFIIEKQSIILKESCSAKLHRLIDRGFMHLKNKNTGRPTVYVHQNSGIPLIGSNYFGIIERNTNLIELRPITGCNLNCIHCSVNEPGEKQVDYVVEKDYLIKEFRKLVKFKGEDDIEAHLNGQGEPLMYSPMPELIKELKSTPGCVKISIDTHGLILTEELVDKLADSGLDQINLSINTLDKRKACEMAGTSYDLEHVVRMAYYIPKRMSLLLAPIWLPGVNDSGVEEIIELAKKLRAKIGIQNYFEHKYGRRPIKQASMETFHNWLRSLEKKHGIKLILDENDFNIHKTKPLPKPFKKGEIIIAKSVCPGRQKHEVLAVYKNRVIQVHGTDKLGNIRAKIIRDKHNIFYGIKR